MLLRAATVASPSQDEAECEIIRAGLACRL